MTPVGRGYLDGGMRMRTLARKLVFYLVTAWVAITINFLIPRLMPGNPIQTMIGKIAGPGHPAAAARHPARSSAVGVNQGLLAQYWHYWGQLLHGNLGVSITLSGAGQHRARRRRCRGRSA